MAGTPSLQSISSLGLLILDGLRDMHRRGYVFVDVKPENFMVLRGPRAAGTTSRGADKDFLPGDQIFFTDFGLMEKLRSYNGGGGQRENETRATLAGNACFCSLDVHACAVPAAKDDVEAVVSAGIIMHTITRVFLILVPVVRGTCCCRCWTGGGCLGRQDAVRRSASV